MKKLLLLSALFICFSGAAQEDSTKVRTNGDLFITSGITMGGTGIITCLASRRLGLSMVATGGILTGAGCIINRVKK